MNIDLETVLSNVYQLIKKTLETFRKIAENLNRYFKKRKQIEDMRSYWVVPYDTRRNSQVLMNKPKFVVRRVIQ